MSAAGLVEQGLPERSDMLHPDATIIDGPGVGLLRDDAPRQTTPARSQCSAAPLGQIMVQMGVLDADDLMLALELQSQQAALLGDILLAHDMIDEDSLVRALGIQFGTTVMSPDQLRPDPQLVDMLGAHSCLSWACLPIRRIGDVTLVATARPDRFAHHRPAIEALFGKIAMAIIPETALHATVLRMRATSLRLWAESCVSDAESCRNLRTASGMYWAAVLLMSGVVLTCLAPFAMLVALTGLAIFALTISTFLKLAAAFAALRLPKGAECSATQMEEPCEPFGMVRKPIVTIMVPLYKEPAVARRLVRRLERLTWPRELLDILLVVEDHDRATQATLSTCDLPRWMRVIPVPEANLKTKPRALNFAMLFARGSIIGVYDAEDAPEPDQIHRVAAAFAHGPPNLACVQGTLDFYNPSVNWLARCFTIEYAAWFRVILPGMQRLGLAVPLGGTTLFFRRDVLEKLGGWDAHNVTEDADLGIRLARHGYYTQLLDTVTYEEANCHLLPWIKQRSRWLKGYAVTYLVHMRSPRALYRQLGAWRFLGVQILFLGTLVQFLLAPLIWSFWIVLAGFSHPVNDTLPYAVLLGFACAFLLSEATNLGVNFAAISRRRHRHLRPWVLSLHLYFPLAAIAAYKGIAELVFAPFYWDKTAHGSYGVQLAGIDMDPLPQRFRHNRWARARAGA